MSPQETLCECGQRSGTNSDCTACRFCDTERKISAELVTAKADIDRLRRQLDEATAPSLIAVQQHPLPWRVDYWVRCEEWDERSCPRVKDATGAGVLTFHQYVGHPGLYDAVADALAMWIVEMANLSQE